MPGVLAPVSYEPIKAVRTLGSQGSTPPMSRTPEDSAQTFQLGVPIMLNASGFADELSTGAANIVYGVSGEPAHNLTVAGQPLNLNEKAPPNQPSAVTTPVGAWPRDGNIGYYLADGITIFSIALKVGQVFTQALIQPSGTAVTLYGLVKDATSGFWYLDNTITGGNAGVAILIGLDSASPNTVAGGARVFFQFAQSRRAFQ